MPRSTDYWLTRPEVGERLKVPVKTLAQWASQGKGPRFAKIGRWTRYRLSDVITWENAQFGDDAARHLDTNTRERADDPRGAGVA